MSKVEVSGQVVIFNYDNKAYVDDSFLSKCSKNEREEVSAKLIEGGLPPVMIDSFADFGMLNQIAKKISIGEDCSLALAFNGIDATEYVEAVKNYQAATLPVIEKLKELIPPYPFMEKPEGATLSFEVKKSTLARGYYSMNIKTAKRIWDRFAPWWADNSIRKPARLYVKAGGGNQVSVTNEAISIGCQQFHRWELEELAVSQGWEIPTMKVEV